MYFFNFNYVNFIEKQNIEIKYLLDVIKRLQITVNNLERKITALELLPPAVNSTKSILGQKSPVDAGQ